jgi:hypothetical protein
MKMNYSNFIFFGFVCGFALLLTGCDRRQAAPAPSTKQTSVVNPSVPAVKRIVFVGKEHACDCTRKVIEESFATLQKTIGTSTKLPIERIQVDTHADKVKPLQQQKAILALPAIYFLGENNHVLELLQGEVTEAQIKRVIGNS